MTVRFYIHEVKSDWSGPEEKILESAYYGPFTQEESQARLYDFYADILEEGGAEISVIEMSDEDATKYYINPRELWMSNLALLQENANAQEDHHV